MGKPKINTKKTKKSLSINSAIATVKEYLTEEKYYIKLHDLVNEEIERVYNILISDQFKTEGIEVTKDVFQKRMREYEELIEILSGMLITLAYFDKGNNAYLLTRAIERIIQPRSRSGFPILIDLQYYPSLLLAYATGITALVRENYHHLAAVVLKPYVRTKGTPTIEFLNVATVFGHSIKFVPFPDFGRRHTPANNYIFDVLREPLRSYSYLPEDEKYIDFFDIFEYLLGLTYKDRGEQADWAPVGCFGWRYRIPGWVYSPIQQFVQQGIKQGGKWGLLKAGFFDGSIERFKDCCEDYESLWKKICGRWI